MAGQPKDHTWSATALVHEAYMRLADADLEWFDKDHFIRTAAKSMVRALVDHARGKQCKKRQTGRRQELDEVDPTSVDGLEDDRMDLKEVLGWFALKFPVHAQFVVLRVFHGLSNRKASSILGVSESTGRRQWRFAHAWLRAALHRRRIPAYSRNQRST